MADDTSSHDGETLEELLADPIVWLVMRSDGVTREAIAKIVTAASQRLQRDPVCARMEEGDPRLGSYRPGVGIMLLNDRGEVWVGRRNDLRETAWQMPQGGIEEGETPRQAAYRELKEEVGCDDAEILAESRGWLYYDLPTDIARSAWNGRWRGQRQKWFVMRFKGRDMDIAVDTENPEFSDWKWVEASELGALIVSFKRNVYRCLLSEVGSVSPSRRPDSSP